MSDSFQSYELCLPGSSIHGISQARILEWVAICSSRGSFQPRDEPMFPVLADGFFTTEPPESPKIILFSSVQSLSCVWFFATPWTAACQASLFITNSQSLPKFMSIELVMPSNQLILSHPLLLLPSLFPRMRVFSNESVLRIRWPNIVVSASTSVLPVNTQDRLPLGWTGWISLQSKGLSRVLNRSQISLITEILF